MNINGKWTEANEEQANGRMVRDKYYMVLKNREHIVLRPFTTIMVVGDRLSFTRADGSNDKVLWSDVACIVNKE